MVSEVFIRSGPGESRVSYTVNGKLKRVLIDRAIDLSSRNGIYLGKIVEINRNLNAAFVEIGLEKLGFLPAVNAQIFDHAREKPKPIGKLFTEGETILVQVTQDPINGKGVKLTTNLSISAFNIVITPGNSVTRLSNRIENKNSRDNIKNLLQGLASPDAGYIIRTKASMSKRDTLVREAKMLSKDWKNIKSLIDLNSAPSVLLPPPTPILRFLLETFEDDLVRIRVEDRQLLLEMRQNFESRYSELLPILESHDGLDGIFDIYDLNDQWEELSSNTVRLSSGASIIIEETAALTAIDVDSGKQIREMRPEDSNFIVNIEAVKEIARQISLRNLGGQIIIDFLNQRQRQKRELIGKAFQEAISEDRKNINLVGFTRLGMFELTRRRHGKSINRQLFNPMEYSKSPITVAFEVLYQVKREMLVNPGKTIFVDTSPIVAKALCSGAAFDAKRLLEKEMISSIEVRINPEHLNFDLSWV